VARHTIGRTEQEAPRWFGRVPAQRCRVEAMPAEIAPGASAASYFPPALDGSRPGTYFANVHRARERMLRRLAPVEAYVEGWGLYAERLAGLYSGAVARLGMLTNDSMRAARLVVDTGLHAHGWSRRQAVDYMTANTPMALIEIESEVDRYIAAPGQALGYMVGRLELERIRAAAEAALGDRFDIRSFHDTVLGSGPLPLLVLDQVVRAWVDDQRVGD
jgi:uncharacterized protein (DUF885 family)